MTANNKIFIHNYKKKDAHVHIEVVGRASSMGNETQPRGFCCLAPKKKGLIDLERRGTRSLDREFR